MFARIFLTRAGIVGSPGETGTVRPVSVLYQASSNPPILSDATVGFVVPDTITYAAAASAPALSGQANEAFSVDTFQYAAAANAPTVADQGNETVSPSTFAYLSTGNDPVVLPQGVDQIVPSTVAYQSQASAPSVAGQAAGSLSPSLLSYLAAVNAPNVAGQANETVSPASVAYAAAANAPTVSAGVGFIAPNTFAYAAASNAPTVAEQANGSIDLNAFDYLAAPNGPNVADQGNENLTLDALAYLAANNLPTIANQSSGLITPSSFAYLSVLNAPTVADQGNGSLLPDALAYLAALNAPTVSNQVNGAVTPDSFAYLAALSAPSLANQSNGSVNPDTFAYTATANAPTVVEETPVAVARIDGWTDIGDGGTFTPSAATDRGIAVAAHAEASDINITGCTYGGVSSTQSIAGRSASAGFRSASAIFLFDEADIAAASGTVVDVTTDVTPQDISVFAAAYENVDQANPVVDTDTSGTNTAGAAPPSLTLDSVADGFIIGSTGSGNNAIPINWTTPTEQLSANEGSSTHNVADGATSGSTADSTPINFTGSNRASQVAMTLRPSSAASTSVAVINALADTGASSTGSAGSFTVGSGSDRLLSLTVYHTGTDSITNIAYGGQNMTRQVDATSTSGFPSGVIIFTLNEAGIASATDANFVVTGSVGGRYRASAIALENVDQTNPVVSTDVIEDDLNGNTMSLTTIDLGLVVAGANVAGNGTFDWTNVTEGFGEEGIATMSYSGATEATDGTALTVDPDVTTGVGTAQHTAASIAFRPAA